MPESAAEKLRGIDPDAGTTAAVGSAPEEVKK